MIKSVDLTTGMCRVIEYMYELMVPGYRMGTSVTHIRAEKKYKVSRKIDLTSFFYTLYTAPNPYIRFQPSLQIIVRHERYH